MGIMYIARHGESVWNAERRIQGQRDVPLSERGVSQAQALASRLAAERIDQIFTSDLQRAHQTAAAVAALQLALHEPLRVRPALRERSYGSWEGLTAAAARARGTPPSGDGTAGASPVAATTTPDAWDGPPDAETFGEVVNRLLDAWTEVAQVLDSGATALVVGHAAALRALLCGLTGTPAAGQRRWQMDTASLSCLTWESGTLSVDWWNDATHTVEPLEAAASVTDEHAGQTRS